MLRRRATVLIWGAIGVACAVLLFGWGLKIDTLVRLWPDFPAMVPATAATIILAGIGSLPSKHRQERVRPLLCAALIVLVVVLKKATPLGETPDLDDDMSIASALAALLAAAALCTRPHVSPPLRSARTVIDTVGLSLLCIPLLGFLFNSEALWGNVVYTKISLHTAVCFFALFSARLMLDADRNWVRVIYAEQIGSQMARRILPVVILGPVALCALALFATTREVVTADFRLTLLAFSVVAIGTFAVIFAAERFNVLERSADILREKLQQHDLDLVRSQKIAVLGQLVGGVAHDFNNILAVIIGNLELLEDSDSDAARDVYVDQAIEAAKQAAALTGQLLAYGRKSRLSPEPVEIDRALTEALAMFGRVSGTGQRVDTTLGAPGAMVHLDRSNLAQVLLNILINARDATTEGGTITAATRIDSHAPLTLSRDIGEKPMTDGPCITVQISDSGTGMDPETLEHATEPYFTTKGVGEGSGLGLSMAQGFCRQSNGELRIESTKGQGTTVTLHFPMLDAGQALPTAPDADPAQARVSNGLILIVDDEEGVTNVMSRQLERDGYEVVTAQDADEAMALIDGGMVPQLVISDIIMPGRLQGHQLAVLIRQLWPGVKVLLMSGYQSNRLRDQYSIAGEIEFLQKPISRATLRNAVAEAIKQP